MVDVIETPYIEMGSGMKVRQAAYSNCTKKILTPKVVAYLVSLHKLLDAERHQLLAERVKRQAEFDNGAVPEYSFEHKEALQGDWKVAEQPLDLLCRRVEITGPVNSTKMVINMLSRNQDGVRADMAMLDFEDSMKPTFQNVIEGIHNVIGAVEGNLKFYQTQKDGSEKVYEIDPNDMPGVMVRVRGLHMDEANVLVDGEPISAGLFDLFTTLYHTAKTQITKGKTPKYYVPKCEHYLEARWWERLFTAAENAVGIPVGTLRATFLIETLPAAFQMEEILYEIRQHAAGFNGGRWDKIFSDIKVLGNHADRIMADRNTIDMNKPWMDNYVKRMIKICHKRGAFAMGGMSAFTPGKTEETRKAQMQKVYMDKKHEATIGHDGCWVSHPYFITHALKAFTRINQLDVMQADFPQNPELLPHSESPKTVDGVRTNIRVGIAYMEGWRNDIGCVSWDDRMEDLATLEISRAQLWQYLHHNVILDDGIEVTKDLVAQLFDEELEKIEQELIQMEMEEPVFEKTLISFRKAANEAKDLFLMEELHPFLQTALDELNQEKQLA